MFELALGIALLTLCLTWLVLFPLRRLLADRRVLDVPNVRSSHTIPIPRGGGLPIVVFTLLGGWILYARLDPPGFKLNFLGFSIGAVLIAIVSWLDDIHSLPSGLRLTVHSLGAVLAICDVGYLRTVSIPFYGPLSIGWLGALLTFIWIVGLTNAYNFMDGIDGIAGAQAVAAGFGWAGLGWLAGQPLVGALGLLLAASSLGFLGHNWHPARIFMGDVSSAFLGYTFAVLPIAYQSDSAAGSSQSRGILAGVLFIWPFVFDTAFTLLRRLRHGENVFTAHRSHLYQRLIVVGYGHRWVTLFYVMLSLVGVALGLVWGLDLAGNSLVVTLVMPLLALALWVFVTRQERDRGVEA